MIGTHTVVVYADPNDPPTGAAVDMSCLVDEVSINHGRGDTSSQCEPSTATVSFTVGPGAPLPPEVDVGAWVVVSTVLAGVTYQRFRGRITDLAIGWDDAGEDTPDAGVGQLVAVGPLADYARRLVGDVPWPQELDGARVARIFAAAGLVLASSDGGRVNVIPRDVDRRSALELAQGAADSAGGLVWNTRAGAIRYADAEHRRGATVALDLDACDVLVTPTWLRNVGGLVNEVSLTYGVAPDGGDRPVYYALSTTSQARYGRYAYSATTELADANDAQSAVTLILIQNAAPAWLLQALPVDVDGLTSAQLATLLGLEIHALIRVTGLPASGNTPATVTAWVEGWTEHLSFGVHDLTLVVSDYCRTAPPPRWDDTPATQTWDTTAPALTWDAYACLGPPAAVTESEGVSHAAVPA